MESVSAMAGLGRRLPHPAPLDRRSVCNGPTVARSGMPLDRHFRLRGYRVHVKLGGVSEVAELALELRADLPLARFLK